MEEKIIATNRKAHHDYIVLDSLMAGIELKGTEVKSLRAGKANLKDSYVLFDKGEAFVLNMHISPYEFGNRYNVDPTRPRKLLLHKNQIRSLALESAQKSYTVVPLKIFFRRGKAKLEIALCKGKKLYDKRDAIKRKQAARDIERALRDRKG
jgi:SsrA-binding protein